MVHDVANEVAKSITMDLHVYVKPALESSSQVWHSSLQKSFINHI